MATNAPLGTSCNPGFFDRGTLALTLHRAPAPLCVSKPTPTEIEHAMRQVAQRLSVARVWPEIRSAIGDLLGPQCFTAGVVAGIGKAAVGTIVELAELIKTLAFAEYYEAKHRRSFGGALTAMMPFGLLGLVAAESMFLVDRFWDGFDRYAKEAHEEREALLQLVVYAFEHPREAFGSIGAAQVARYEAFKKDLARKTIVGNFDAGMRAGELLFEVLLLIDGVTAIAKIAATIPRMARLLPKLRELAPALRTARQKGAKLESSAAKDAAKPAVKDAVKQTEPEGAQQVEREAADQSAKSGDSATAVSNDGKPRFPDRELPRDKNGRPIADRDPNIVGPHTQLGQEIGRKVGKYDKAREFNAEGEPVRDIDFTDHGRPQNHTNPHQHRYEPNPTGGTPQYGPAEPLDF